MKEKFINHVSPKGIGVVAFGILLVLYGYNALIWYSFKLHGLYLYVHPLINTTYLGIALVTLFAGVEIFESKYKILACFIKAALMCVMYILLLDSGVVDLDFLSETSGVVYTGLISIILIVIMIVLQPMSLISMYKKSVSDLTQNAQRNSNEK